MKEMIFFDVDNTLVDAKTHKISKSTLLALQEMGEYYELGIATGRSLSTLYDNGVLSAYPWRVLVCNNGQLVYDQQGRILYDAPMDPSLVQAVMEVAKHNHLPLLLGTPDWYQYGEVNADQIKAHEFFHFPIPGPIHDSSKEPVYMMVGFGSLHHDYKEYAQIKGIQIIPGQSTYCDIVAAGSGKEQGILAAQAQLHFPSYLAFGDSDNDLGMFSHARYAIAMGQGSQLAKQKAHWITSSVQEDGILYAWNHCDIFHHKHADQ